MRPGLNIIRITAEAECDWQRLMQEPREDLEIRAVQRAVKAGEAAVRSASMSARRGGRARPTMTSIEGRPTDSPTDTDPDTNRSS